MFWVIVCTVLAAAGLFAAGWALFLYQNRLLPTKRFLARKMKSETEGHVIVVKGSL